MIRFCPIVGIVGGGATSMSVLRGGDWEKVFVSRKILGRVSLTCFRRRLLGGTDVLLAQ